MRHPLDLDFQFDSATATQLLPVGIQRTAQARDRQPVRWERLRTWTAALAAMAAAFLLSGSGSSLDRRCADMSEGSWFHVEYCQPNASESQTWARTPGIQIRSGGEFAAGFPLAALPMTPVAQSLRPLR